MVEYLPEKKESEFCRFVSVQTCSETNEHYANINMIKPDGSFMDPWYDYEGNLCVPCFEATQDQLRARIKKLKLENVTPDVSEHALAQVVARYARDARQRPQEAGEGVLIFPGSSVADGP